jgi:hypothetical protein
MTLLGVNWLGTTLLGMTWLSVAIVAASAAALIAAYMRKPRALRRLRLSTAKFLVDLSPATRSRIALAPLLQSPLFWVRMLTLALIAAALLMVVKWNPAGGEARLGLRIVVDTTASMGVTAGPGAGGAAAMTRAAEARALVEALLKDKDAERRAQNFRLCVTILAVDRETRDVSRSSDALPADMDAAFTPRRLGGDPRLLESVALGEDSRCRPTHAIVVTDRRKPAVPAAADGRSVLWWQVGRPVPNAAIEAVTVDADPLIEGPVRVRFAVRQYGGTGGPSRQPVVTRPDGTSVQPDAAGCGLGVDEFCFEAPAPGRYAVALSGTDAFAGDDRAVVDVSEIKTLAVEWRLTQIPAPPALHVDTGPGAILVARTEDNPDVASRRAVLVGGDWPLRPGGSKLGFFNAEDPLLENVNIDLLEQAAPSRVPVPAGFVRAASADDGGDIVARRVSPRAAIIPPPLLRPDTAAPLRNASLLLFANALRYVSEDQAPPAAVSFIDADGHELPGVEFESNTAEDGDRTDLTAAIAPEKASGGDGPPPLWPWLVVLALAVLAAERAAALAWRTA